MADQAHEAENTWWEFLRDLAISHEHLRELVELLEADFSAEDGGYRQLHALNDPIQRTGVSDQICLTALAIRANLVEARLHQHRFETIVGGEGARYPEPGTLKETLRQGAEMDMELTGCTCALGSALDCLGALAIGVLRMPCSITRGSFSDIKRTANSKPPATSTAKQQRFWSDLHQLCENHRKQPPDGWLDWLFGMRNLNVHRARQARIRVQRTRDTDQPQAVIMTAEPHELVREAARFDTHLRRRPELPDMQDFITTSSTTDLWINEPAITTLPGVVQAVNELTEEAAGFLASCWRYARKWSTEFPAPAEKWKLRTPPWSSFDGIAPRPTPYMVNHSRGGPLLGGRLGLAKRLSQQKA